MCISNDSQWPRNMQQSMQEADKQRTSRHFPAAYLFTLTAPSGCAKHHKPKLAQNRPDRQSCGTKYLWGNNMNIEQQKPQLVRWVLHGIAYLQPKCSAIRQSLDMPQSKAIPGETEVTAHYTRKSGSFTGETSMSHSDITPV